MLTSELDPAKEYAINLGIMVGSSIEYKKLGLFTFEHPEINDGQYRYKGYDRMMYKFNMLYSTALTGAHKTSEYMAEIARLTGVPFVSALEDITITMLPGYTYREVIGYIAALHGANAIINDDGNLEFRWYTQCDYSPAHIYMGGITYGMTDDYTLNMIKCTVTTQTDSGSEDVTYTSGTGSTGISINNPFMTQALLDSIYAKIGGLVYRPMTVSFSGDVLPELGDIVNVVDSGRTYKCPIMQMSHDYDGGIKTEIVSVGSSASESTKDTSGPLTKAMERYYADLVLINEAFVTKLTAQEAKIDKLDAEKITVSYLDAHYANLQLTNIEAGSIKTAMIATGAIETAQIADGSITDAKIVSLTANKLSAGTIDASKIEVTNLNCANLTVGTINGQQIASGAVDMSKLGSDMTSWITSTDSGVNKALADAGIANTNATAAKKTADSASTTATAASKKADTAQSTADSASSAAASAGTKADNALSVANGITVGGRNLLHKYLRAGRNTSKIDDLSIKIGAVNSTDTYFYLKICTALEKGQTYTLSCEASNVPDGCDWYFGITSQTSIWQIHINKNGKCYATTTLNININAESEIIVDDINGRPSSAVNIILKNFKLEKGNKATDWTPAPEDVDKSIANAVSIANGKNTAYYQTSQPTGGTYKVNDNWFNTDDGYRMYYWNGSKWMPTEYGASAIAANAITADKIAASAITAGKIAAGAITADKIAANAVTTNKIAANAITAGQIAAGTITATQIASKTITADNLHADCITSNKIVASAITADKIAANAITANKIASNAITADKLSVASLSAISANLGAITSGSLNIGSGNFVVDTAGNLTNKGTMSIGNGGITYTPAGGLSVFGDIKVKNALKMYFNDTTGAYDGKEHYFDVLKITINAEAPYLDVMSIFTEGSATFNGGLATAAALSAGSLTVSGGSTLIGNVTVTGKIYPNGGIYANDGSLITYDFTYKRWAMYCASGKGWSIFDGVTFSAPNFATSGYVTFKTLDGTSNRCCIGTVSTDKQRVSNFGVNASGALVVKCQSGTGITYGTHKVVDGMSDQRLKCNISDCNVSALPIIDRIRLRSFDWVGYKNNRHQNIGFIADEIEMVDPYLSDGGGGYNEDGSINIKSVDTFYLQGYEVKAIQELHQMIKMQQQMIYNLQFELAKLQA